MKKLITLSAITLALVSCEPPCQNVAREILWESVLDGDTIATPVVIAPIGTEQADSTKSYKTIKRAGLEPVRIIDKWFICE